MAWTFQPIETKPIIEQRTEPLHKLATNIHVLTLCITLHFLSTWASRKHLDSQSLGAILVVGRSQARTALHINAGSGAARWWVSTWWVSKGALKKIKRY